MELPSLHTMSTEPSSPAFPTGPYNGLTKRELFAAMAMNGMLAGDDGCPWYSPDGKTKMSIEQIVESISAQSVKYADGLIAALGRK